LLENIIILIAKIVIENYLYNFATIVAILNT